MTGWNAPRWRPGRVAYESWFLRANHPSRPLAFWIRYTILAPAGGPAVGERWAIWSDGERGTVTAVRDAVPVAECAFADGDVRIGAAWLRGERAVGEAAGAHRIGWELGWESAGAAPVLLLPEYAYDRPFPKANAVSPVPDATFSGTVVVDGARHPIDGWRGSQNHNWGRAHTDRYAWGQVVGFDGDPGALLECATARVKAGPVWSPTMSFAVLQLDGERHVATGVGAALAARAAYGPDGDGRAWRLATRVGADPLEISFYAPGSRAVTLAYGNPPGGEKACWNSKLAAVEVRYRGKVLRTESRGAFEILE